MGIVDDIKKSAVGNGTKIQSSEASELEKIFNKMFFLPKDIKGETQFVKSVMTRGLETTERVGMHASSIIESDAKYCKRRQILSLIYRQLQGEQNSAGLRRIFEEGNAIHEKWQRLFIRAGYSKPNELDVTQENEKYMISYTPDIICTIPEFFEGKMIGEIKSVNTYQFAKMTKHPSASKQCMWYMALCIEAEKALNTWNGIDYTKGFVLCEDKNTQDFKIEVYDYDPEAVATYINRCDEIIEGYYRVFKEHKMVARPNDAKSCDSKRCKNCNMKVACWTPKQATRI